MAHERTSPDFLDTLAILEEMKRGNQLQEKYGYFYLPGEEEIVESRRRSLVISELKLKRLAAPLNLFAVFLF